MLEKKAKTGDKEAKALELPRAPAGDPAGGQAHLLHPRLSVEEVRQV